VTTFRPFQASNSGHGVYKAAGSLQSRYSPVTAATFVDFAAEGTTFAIE